MKYQMSDSSHKNNPCLVRIIFISIAVVFLVGSSSAFAGKELSLQQQEARAYRAKGLEYQSAGDLMGAADFYQSAIALDPLYAVAYNDLAIIYEAAGNAQQARQLYLAALDIDPELLSAYANLALICEQERDLEKAAYYWGKRVELGNPDEPWTIKAKERLADIRLVLSDNPDIGLKEQVAVGLSAQLEAGESLISHGSKEKGNKVLAKEYFDKAKGLYKQGRDVDAFRIAFDAQQMDPSNTKIEEFLSSLTTRILSR